MYAAVALFVVFLRANRAIRFSNKSLMSRCFLRLRDLLVTAEGIVLTFFSSHLAFLLLAYFTDNQPEIWPRYGLIFFTLGLPLFASYCLTGSARVPQAVGYEARIKRRSLTLTYVTAALFAVQFCAQLVDVTRITVKNDPNVIAAEFLEDQRNADGFTKVYCEDGAIRVLSGIPLEEFRDQYNSPADEEAFLESLKDNQVRFLVYKDLPGSRLKEMIARIRERTRNNGITLEEIVPRSRRNVKDHVIVYRVHENELANAATEHSKANEYHRR